MQAWFIGAMLLIPSTVRAAAPVDPVTGELLLDWTAPADCPQQREVAAEVQRQHGGELAPGQRLEARGWVVLGADGQWHARLETALGGVEGRRELVGADCAEVSSAAALVLAMMLQPLEGSPPVAPRLEAPRVDPPPSPLPPEEQRQSARSRRGSRSGYARLAWVGGAGLLPGPAVGASVQGGIVARRLALGFAAHAWLPRTAASEDEVGMGAEFAAQSVRFELCGGSPLGSRRVRFDSCFGAGIQRVTGRGYGMTDPGVGRAEWVSLSAAEGLAIRLSDGFWLRPSVVAQLPVARPRFAVEHIGALHRPAIVAGSGELALEVGF